MDIEAWRELELHPMCEAFPDMSAEEFEELRASMMSLGLRLPIIIYEGKILDGRHRHRICAEECIPPRFEEFDGKGGIHDYVVAMNLRRRNLNDAQKIEIGLKLADIIKERAAARKAAGENVATLPPAGKTREIVAKGANVSPRTVQEAMAVRKEAPAVWQEVLAGKESISGAAKKVRKKPKSTMPGLTQAEMRAAIDKVVATLRAVADHIATMAPAEFEAKSGLIHDFAIGLAERLGDIKGLAGMARTLSTAGEEVHA